MNEFWKYILAYAVAIGLVFATTEFCEVETDGFCNCNSIEHDGSDRA